MPGSVSSPLPRPTRSLNSMQIAGPRLLHFAEKAS